MRSIFSVELGLRSPNVYLLQLLIVLYYAAARCGIHQLVFIDYYAFLLLVEVLLQLLDELLLLRDLELVFLLSIIPLFLSLLHFVKLLLPLFL